MKVQDLFEDSMALQQRVQAGINAQKLVIAKLEKDFGDDFELISTAGASSTAPDVVANISGHRTQFEIKKKKKKGVLRMKLFSGYVCRLFNT